MSKNLIICCDGTNNSYLRDLTNVARLSQIAVQVPGQQRVYYDAGVGTEEPGFATRVGATLYRWGGLAFGTGLVTNVVEAYRELVRHYEPGAQVFLFGFSRGAYTVRVLVGLLENYGLLRREYASEVETIVEHFQTLFPKQGSKTDRDPVARKAHIDKSHLEARIVREEKSIPCPVHFLGLWDTVSSLGWAYDPKTFPNTATMPAVRTIRHAMAIDERRAKFRTNRVITVPGANQDIQEVWFAGVHADVGGGYREQESGLAKVCLDWMLREAVGQGLLVDPAMVERFLSGSLVPPDEFADQHESLGGFWWPLEFMRLPHRKFDKGQWIDEMIRYRGNGWRTIRPGDLVHTSLQRRITRCPIKNTNWPAAESGVVWLD